MGDFMRIAYLNLCHTDPQLVARAAGRLLEDPDADMYIHVDAKTDIVPFLEAVHGDRVHFLKKRRKVYWGGFHAVLATLELIRAAASSDRGYDRYVLLQNLDYPIRSWQYIHRFFEEHADTEFIRACRIAGSHDWHFEEKYKILHNFDDDFYLHYPNRAGRILHNGMKYVRSIPHLLFDGVIREKDGNYPVFYGSAQWALTGECAKYVLSFAKGHPEFNRVMRHVKFPDEEYFQTIVHNSPFEKNCSVRSEPEKRWLVNWRNLHYYEYPGTIVTFTEKDYGKLMERPGNELFIRKVRTGESDGLLDLLDQAAHEGK